LGHVKDPGEIVSNAAPSFSAITVGR
jgi:hypothetical protein